MKRSALKGRKLAWINPTHIAPQNEFRGEGDLSGESAKNMDMTFHSADLDLAPFQGAAPRGVVPGVETWVETPG